ncbi:MAG: ABC transporter substrate-binding protein [Kaiparowitsia implicata GSE-PSE-MK54-09C]|jgi:NitT/TauT family transport system substrate-binding protein|nr:ABC transporter substrate-binding protein [Kaiparowitsia implicata GSE-PSE-MK54-09C]
MLTLRRRGFMSGAIAALATVLMVNACATSPVEPQADSAAPTGSAANTSPAELTTVRFTLDWAVQGVHAPIGVAIEKGYFAEEGLDIQFEPGSGSADAITKVASGAFDMGLGDINSLMEFNVNNPDTPVRAVAIYYNQSPMAIMALDESDITEPSDLENKTLGIPAGSATRRLLPLFAEASGLNLEAVDVPAIESRLQQTLLLTKEIDAIAPFTISALPNLAEAGYPEERLNIFRFKDYGLDLYGNSVLVPASYLESNPEVVRGFIRALTRGLRDTLNDPDEAIEIMSQFDDLFEIPLERERLQIAIDTLFLSPEVEENGFGAVDPERFQRSIDLVVKGFDLSEPPAADDIFDDRFLPDLSDRQLN